MMRLIDAEELKRRIVAFTTGVHTNYLVAENIMMLINQANTVDAIIPVRCINCTWYDRHGRCTNPHCGKSWYGCPVPSNHYCSYGEPYSNIKELPDESITNEEMRSYGYTWGGMIPMREKAATEVIKFCTVYRLYADDTESMVLDENEISAHAVKGGIFGVQRADWEAAGKC